jgi:hypothetical protein
MSGPSRFRKGARLGRHPLSALLGGVLALAASSGDARAGKCYELEPGEQVRGSRTWYELYARAVETIEGKKGKAGAAEVQEAVTHLRVVVKEKPHSDPGARHPITKESFPYFPYFYLGWGLEQLGRVEPAEECLLQHQSAVGQLDPSEKGAGPLQDRLKTLLADLTRKRQEREMLAWVEGLPDWARKVESCVSAGGRKALADLRQEAQGLVAKGSVSAEVRDRLLGDTSGLVRGELTRLQAWFDGFSAPAWSDLLAGRKADPECAPAGGTGSEAEVQRAQDKLATCCLEADVEVRRIGGLACARLQGIEGLPAGLCRTPPQGSFDDLRAELEKLDYPGRTQAIAESRRKEQERLEQYRAGLREIENRIAYATASCAGDLSMESANDRLVALERTVRQAREAQSPDTSRDLGSDLGALKAGLVAAANDGVRGLIARRDEYHSKDPAAMADEPFSRLRGAAAGLGPDYSAADLGRLCGAVAETKGEFVKWVAKNVGSVEPELERYRWLLGALQDAVAGSLPVPCLAESIDGLPGKRRGDAIAWSEAASEGIAAARGCLEEYRNRREAWLGDVRSALGAFGEAKDGIAAGMPARVRECTAAGEEPGALLGLVESADGRDPDGLRGRLDAAGLASRDWDKVEEARSAGEEELGQVLTAIRDRAVLPGLSRAVARLSDCRPLIERARVHGVLAEAFDRFAEGDVDAAIVRMRESTVEGGSLDPDVRALAHASLSYFLYTKWSLLGGDARTGEAGTALDQDARTEARAALASRPGFQPPPALFQDARFVAFFKDI